LPLEEILFYYSADPVTIKDPVLLIRINKFYRHGMSDQELYEATRGVWKVSDKRYKAKYAMAVFEGIVREVYTIKSWHKAGTTKYSTRSPETYDPNINNDLIGRYEFVGLVSSENIRSRYYGKCVEPYFKKGDQASVRYINVF
jgi:hypothetical protein